MRRRGRGLRAALFFAALAALVVALFTTIFQPAAPAHPIQLTQMPSAASVQGCTVTGATSNITQIGVTLKVKDVGELFLLYEWEYSSSTLTAAITLMASSMSSGMDLSQVKINSESVFWVLVHDDEVHLVAPGNTVVRSFRPCYNLADAKRLAGLTK